MSAEDCGCGPDNPAGLTSYVFDDNVDMDEIIIQAQTIESDGEELRAYGCVFFRHGKKKMTAGELRYNTVTGAGMMKNVEFSTCKRPKADYMITARELVIYPGMRLKARGICVHIAGTRIFCLPEISHRASKGGGGGFNLPSPSFDSYDGVSLTQRFTLIDRPSTRSFADVTLSWNNGLFGEAELLQAVGGELTGLPGRSLEYESLRSNTVKLPERIEPFPEDVRDFYSDDSAKLRTYTRLSFNRRAYDITNPDLTVSKQPELGARYHMRTIELTRNPIDPRLEIYPAVEVFWGMFKESPGIDEFKSRYGAKATGAAHVYDIDRDTPVQVAAEYKWTKYETNDSFRTTTYAADVSRLVDEDMLASLRYVKRSERGSTPFQFDNVDIHNEIQAGLRLQKDMQIYGAAVSYDMDAQNMYDWELMWGYRSDCLEGFLKYNGRVSRFDFSLSLLLF